MGIPELDFEIRILDFPMKREIQKRVLSQENIF